MTFNTKAFYLHLPLFLVAMRNFAILPANSLSNRTLYSQHFDKLIFLNCKGFVSGISNDSLFLTYFYSKNCVIVVYSKDYLKDYSFILTRFINLLKAFVTKSSFGFYIATQFIGFRYRQRWFRTGQVIRFRLGYNKKVFFKCPLDFIAFIRKISPKKRAQFYFSYNISLLKSFIYLAYSSRPATIYKGRGINFKRQPMVLREGKKALW